MSLAAYFTGTAVIGVVALVSIVAGFSRRKQHLIEAGALIVYAWAVVWIFILALDYVRRIAG